MTVKALATLKTDIATAIADGGANTAAEVRTAFTDTIDSLNAVAGEVNTTYSRQTTSGPVTLSVAAASVGKWRTIDSGTFSGAVTLANTSFVRFVNCVFNDSVAVSSCSHIMFRDCYFPNRAGTAPALSISDSESIAIWDMVCDGSARDAIRVTNSTDVDVYSPTIDRPCQSSPTTQSYAVAGRPKEMSLFAGTFEANATTDTITTNGVQTLAHNDTIRFGGTGTLPGGLTAGSVYYVKKRSQTFAGGAVNTGTDTITITAHGFQTDDLVVVTSTGSVPGGLVSAQTYAVLNATTNTLQLATLPGGGSAIDLTTSGSGTHTIRYAAKMFQVAASSGGAAIDLTTAGSGNRKWYTQTHTDRSNSHAGITFDGCTRFRVSGGTINDSLQSAVYCQNSSAGDIAGLSVRRCGQYFDASSSTYSQGVIDLYDCAGVHVHDNILRASRTFGIRVGGDTDAGSVSCRVRDNIVQTWDAHPGALFDPVRTFTASGATITAAGHVYPDGSPVQLTTSGTLPTGLSLATTYYVRDVNYVAGTLSLSATPNGSPISTTAAGSGTHTMDVVLDAYNCEQIMILESHNCVVESNLTRWGATTGLAQGNCDRCIAPVIIANHSTTNGIHKHVSHADGINIASAEYAVVAMNLLTDNPRTGFTLKAGGNLWSEHTIHDTRVIANTLLSNGSNMTTAGYSNPSVGGNGHYYTQDDFGLEYTVDNSRTTLFGNVYQEGYYFDTLCGATDVISFGEMYSNPVAQYQMQVTTGAKRVQVISPIMHGRENAAGGDATIYVDSDSSYVQVRGGIMLGQDPVDGTWTGNFERLAGATAGDLTTILSSDKRDRLLEIHSATVTIDGIFSPVIAATNQQASTYSQVTSVRLNTPNGWLKPHAPLRMQTPSSDVMYAANGYGMHWLTGATDWPTATSTINVIANTRYEEGRELFGFFREVGNNNVSPMLGVSVGGSTLDRQVVTEGT